MKLQGIHGEKEIEAKNLRLWIGPTFVRSENFQAKIAQGMVSFEGKGWGHGVGLCQWGALGLSFLLREYDDILDFYYPSSELKKVY